MRDAAYNRRAENDRHEQPQLQTSHRQTKATVVASLTRNPLKPSFPDIREQGDKFVICRTKTVDSMHTASNSLFYIYFNRTALAREETGDG